MKARHHNNKGLRQAKTGKLFKNAKLLSKKYVKKVNMNDPKVKAEIKRVQTEQQKIIDRRNRPVDLSLRITI